MTQDGNKKPNPPLPIDHGQFGRSDATEEYKPLAPPPEDGTPGGGSEPGKAARTE